MHKKHIFLRVFQKITIFACVFCVFSACADTTTCDIDYTPVTGNSWQNGTPTPTNPVAIESVGTKIGNKYYLSVTTQGNLLNRPNGTYLSKSNGSVTVSNNITTVDVQFNSAWSIYKLTGNVDDKSIAVSLAIMKGNSTDSVLFKSGHTYIVKLFDSTKDYYDLQISNTTNNMTVTDGVPFTPAANFNALWARMNQDGQGSQTGNKTFKIMIVEGSVAPESYIPYSAPITTTVYLDEPLRKVGNYADVLDYKNGTITRNVGVKVLDGTEGWGDSSVFAYRKLLPITLFNPKPGVAPVCSHFVGTKSIPSGYSTCGFSSTDFIIHYTNDISTADFKSYLAAQYANGTPVTIYYPLATPVVEQIENWSCTPPITDIKIATTKMVDEEFAQAEANLAATVQTIESVVSRTIAQTGQIATLHETKQTRPDENCPANMKCLLVQDEDGTPHWYPIIEP
ncbi:MAG: hypothetical protein MJ164_03355 [Alphaproteobacteria bacterium]|nr:hypothetical protein [Alphaproteobacteria bacterium]